MTKNYDLEFKKTLVSLYEQGQSVLQLAKEYNVSQTGLYKWIGKYSSQAEKSVSQADYAALQKELARSKEQNEILKKALSIFAQK